MIDPKIETFLKICELKNYTSVAKALNLTQPAVSQHVKALENEYNVKLFIRNNNDLKLTNEGEILLKYAKRLANIYSDLAIKLEDEKKHTKTLTIGITHTSESNAIAEVLALYCSINKGSRINIISDTIKNLYDKLSSYEIDLAIVEGKIPSRKYSSILLDTDSLVAVMSTSNPLAKNKTIAISDLKKENLILRSSQSQTRTLFANALENIDISLNDFNIILEIDNIATIKDLIAKNCGVSVLPKSACYHEIKHNILAIRPVENLNMIRQINMVFLKDFTNQNTLDEILSIYNSFVK